MGNNELSTNVITHKLVIKGEGTKYIGEDFAKGIFSQLANPEKKTITIANPETLLFITKYRSEIQLAPLDKENKSFEDKLHLAGLSEDQKERFRAIWSIRKKENKSIGDNSFKEIVQAIRDNKL